MQYGKKQNPPDHHYSSDFVGRKGLNHYAMYVCMTAP